jgi:YD repeat-containing protein
MLRRAFAVALAVFALVAVADAQPPAIQYAYDELGRLVAVVDQQGNTAIYVYDAVGNLLAIERFDAAALPGVAITAVVPDKGKAGTRVSILGKGFGGAGQNTVAFNGAPAVVAQAASNRIVTAVPSAATSGLITVTAPLGAALSPRPFRIVGTLAVAPAAVSLGAGGAQQFVASEGGLETTGVVWSVDGVVGGDAFVGTISLQGRYVAPSLVPALRTAAVTATSRDDASVTAAALVTLRPPAPAFLAAASLGVQVADPAPRTAVASALGVQRAPGAATIVAPLLSASVAPSISAVSPSAAARGATNLPLTVSGSGLAGTTALEFLFNGAVDGALSAAELTATTDGTQLTARISIAAGAVVGARVVRARGPGGSTTSAGTGGNVLTVQ